MTKFKPGDRVKVEYEGVVTTTRDSSEWMVVESRGSHITVPCATATLLAPAEPTGLGAVVRVGEALYVRNEGRGDYFWRSADSELLTWAQVCALGTPEVLSEGVNL